ncbi:single-stranded-DNA-specific exonuclease RecJ [Helicobacter jaachi]|uniref:Single-stranded-DNA-specific exonuclease RecJ n=1 Tax=Helicobacter jaachi TaxID=1677920 RepID=A0A4V6I2U3_9HELI|nr:single-stranded-DNA-specific exonuclease RecJ [Helicobacter jaachi]TLD97472.1 single-stranded-DNA-specific exonuclease RecJ [Helicobacter jaachi]
MQKLNKQSLRALLQSRDIESGIHSLRDLPLPSSLTFALQGAQIVSEAMQKGQEILVVGDYDADGVCASAVMIKFFEHLGYAHFRLIIPHRFEDGYGVSAALLDKYAHNAAVVISVDNGITALSAATWCKQRGVALIITDHHTPTDTLPEASVIINPYLPQCTFEPKAICGAVVAWYFCAALKQILKANIDMSIFLEYLAIATIADVMPLVGVNRMLVKSGIKRLKSLSTPFASLTRAKCKMLNAQNLAFSLVPLLNCAGRIAHANLALELLLAPSISAANLAYERLSSLNSERKALQAMILESARANIIESKHFVISYARGWHEGVLGIVAAQLAQEMGKSAFVLSQDEQILKGSGRSNGELNLIASLTPLSEILLTFGGHSGAVGLSLEVQHIQDFVQALESTLVYAEETQESAALGVLESCDIDMELLDICEAFEPYGCGNPKPIFVCEDLNIESIKPLGKAGAHFSYTLKDKRNNITLRAIEFFAPHPRQIGQSANVSFELIRDDFSGMPTLKIKDFMP